MKIVKLTKKQYLECFGFNVSDEVLSQIKTKIDISNVIDSIFIRDTRKESLYTEVLTLEDYLAGKEYIKSYYDTGSIHPSDEGYIDLSNSLTAIYWCYDNESDSEYFKKEHKDDIFVIITDIEFSDKYLFEVCTAGLEKIESR